MTFKTNPYYRMFMNTILLHCLVCFLHASFVEDSLLVYICMLYIGVLTLGQYAIRQRVHNFVAYLLLHILLLAPCALFLIFSVLDVVIMGLFAIILTGLSFKKSVNNKTAPADSNNTVSPFTTLLLPVFAIVGSYYEFPVYTKFVFVEAAIFLVLFICYTFNVNERQYIRDHCSTANIPVKRILATTANVKYVFIAAIVVVMLLVMGINIVIPKFSHDYDPSMINPPISSDTQFEDDNKYPDLSELHEGVKPPSALAVFLSYVFAGLIVIACVVLLFVLIFSVFKSLRNNISPEKQSSTYFEEDEITVESLSVKRSGKRRTFERAVTNNEKVRKLFRNATIKRVCAANASGNEVPKTKKISPADNRTLGSILNSKTPTEINEVLKAENAYSDEIIRLYQEARYSNHEVSGEAVKKMRRQL